MLTSKGSSFAFRYTNVSAPVAGASYGTSVIPGASGVEGDWTEVASAASVAQDVYVMSVMVHAGATTAVSKKHLLDIGIDEAGGTSYTAIISNIVCGFSTSLAVGTVTVFTFPIRIKAGSSIAVRIQGSDATAGTVIVAVRLWGKPARPEAFRSGAYSETVGAIASTGGVAFTPGSTGSEGAWTSLGTTTKDLWWWQIGVQYDDATMTGSVQHFDLAYGDGSNKDIIIENLLVITSSSEAMGGVPAPCFMDFYREVPAGSEIFIRGSTSSATVDSGANAVAIGIGG